MRHVAPESAAAVGPVRGSLAPVPGPRHHCAIDCQSVPPPSPPLRHAPSPPPSPPPLAPSAIRPLRHSSCRDRTGELVEWLRRLGPEQSVDVDQAALRVTLDVIGLVRALPYT
jgi:hypothetical protein